MLKVSVLSAPNNLWTHTDTEHTLVWKKGSESPQVLPTNTHGMDVQTQSISCCFCHGWLLSNGCPVMHDWHVWSVRVLLCTWQDALGFRCFFSPRKDETLFYSHVAKGIYSKIFHRKICGKNLILCCEVAGLPGNCRLLHRHQHKCRCIL